MRVNFKLVQFFLYLVLHRVNYCNYCNIFFAKKILQKQYIAIVKNGKYYFNTILPNPAYDSLGMILNWKFCCFVE